MADTPPDPGTRTHEPVLAMYNLTVPLPTMGAARRALEALDWAGVPTSDVSLNGSLARTAIAEDTADADGQFGATAIRSTLGGAAVGSMLGGAVGLVVGGVTFGLTGADPALAAGTWATTLGGTAAGGGIGFTAGAMTTMKQSQAWALALQDVGEGDVLVEVHTDDARQLSKASKALQRHGFGELHAFDGQGNDTSLPAGHPR